MRNSFVEAIQHVENSLQIYKNLGYAWGMAIAYTNMGVLNFSLGDWTKAVENFELADTLRKEHGNTLERPTDLKNLGETLICMGEFTRAREILDTHRPQYLTEVQATELDRMARKFQDQAIKERRSERP